MINTVFETYLDTVDRCLKPLPASERADIVREIKSSILEMEQEKLKEEQILKRLGSPKELARAYLGDMIAKEKKFSWSRVLTVCAFYGLAGFSGMFVIPMLGIIAPAFILCAIIAPIAGLVKFACSLFGYDVPYIMFQFGEITLSPAFGFLYSILAGAVLFFLGKGAWQLLLHYMKAVGKTKKNLYI